MLPSKQTATVLRLLEHLPLQILLMDPSVGFLLLLLLLPVPLLFLHQLPPKLLEHLQVEPRVDLGLLFHLLHHPQVNLPLPVGQDLELQEDLQVPLADLGPLVPHRHLLLPLPPLHFLHLCLRKLLQVGQVEL